MARPTTLPGIMAPLAKLLGVSALAETLATSPRTLHNWAHNISAMPAVEAGLLSDLCDSRSILPILHTHPRFPEMYVASTPEGWLVWSRARYGERRRYKGPLEGLVVASEDVWAQAITSGWPHHQVPLGATPCPPQARPLEAHEEKNFLDIFASLRAMVYAVDGKSPGVTGAGLLMLVMQGLELIGGGGYSSRVMF